MHESITSYIERHQNTVGPNSDPMLAVAKAIGDVLIDLRLEIERDRPEHYEWDVIPVGLWGSESPKETEESIAAFVDGKTDEGWTFVDARPIDGTSLLFIFRRRR